MDIKEIDKISEELAKKYLEQRIIDNQIVDKAIIFFNQYYNLVEHPITRDNVEKLSNIDFSIKLDFLAWKMFEPKTDEEIKRFYRVTPFDFFRNLLKNMDVMHYEKILKKIILPHLRKNNYKTVLDYGGGSGYNAILLDKLGYKISFAEISKISIEWMRYITKELGVNIEIIDLQEEEIKNNYDTIILKDIIEHLVNPEQVLNNLSKNTKNLLIIPEKIEKTEDYLPMHFPYEIKNG